MELSWSQLSNPVKTILERVDTTRKNTELEIGKK